MSGRITQLVYMGLGSSGAMTDVSSYVDLVAGVSYSYGRSSEFDDASPGTFSFTLDNADGRFTPDNAGSPYATTVTEGMQVCWQAGSRLVSGSVIGVEPAFPGDDAAWSQVVISCDDMLGDAARYGIYQSLPYSVALENADPFFSLDEVAGTGLAYSRGPLYPQYWMQPYGSVTATFGVEGESGLFSSQLDLSVPAATVGYYYATDQDPNGSALDVGPAPLPYTVGVWITPMNTTSYVEFQPATASPSFKWGIQNGAFMFFKRSTTTWLNVGGFIPGEPHYIEISVTNTTATMYIDGVQVATDVSAHVFVPAIRFILGDAAYGATQIRIAQIAVSTSRLGIYAARETTAAERFALIDAAASDITFGTLPSGLSTATIAAEAEQGSALDMINALIRAEQGHVYTATTGTVSSPVQTIVVRERDRPITVKSSYDAEDEGSGSPTIIREITNLLKSATISGPVNNVRVTSTTTRTSATDTESVELLNVNDLKAWGEDRLIRGANTRLRVKTITVDAFTTPTDRSADLLALVPGDRIQITNLPSTVLGFSTWDGWVLGANETHSIDSHAFELKLQPVLPADPIYDTDRFMSAGEITLNAGINSSVTSIVYATTGSEMEATAVPYVITIDSEQMNVTAVNTGTNTLTVTRGYNSTTAASHLAAAAIEVTDDALYAF